MKRAHRNSSDAWGAVREKRYYTALRNGFRFYYRLQISTIFFEEAAATRARMLRPDLLAQFSLSQYGLMHILRHKALPA